MITVTFCADGYIYLTTPNGNGTRHTMFDSTSSLINYMNENGIVEDRIVTE